MHEGRLPASPQQNKPEQPDVPKSVGADVRYKDGLVEIEFDLPAELRERLDACVDKMDRDHVVGAAVYHFLSEMDGHERDECVKRYDQHVRETPDTSDKSETDDADDGPPETTAVPEPVDSAETGTKDNATTPEAVEAGPGVPVEASGLVRAFVGMKVWAPKDEEFKDGVIACISKGGVFVQEDDGSEELACEWGHFFAHVERASDEVPSPVGPPKPETADDAQAVHIDPLNRMPGVLGGHQHEVDRIRRLVGAMDGIFKPHDDDADVPVMSGRDVTTLSRMAETVERHLAILRDDIEVDRLTIYKNLHPAGETEAEHKYRARVYEVIHAMDIWDLGCLPTGAPKQLCDLESELPPSRPLPDGTQDETETSEVPAETT